MVNEITRPDTAVVEELLRLRALLDLEKEEDLRQYREKILHSPLAERKKQGLCWHPVQIVERGYTRAGKPWIEVERRSGLNEPHQFSFGSVAALFAPRAIMSKDNPQLSGIINAVRPNRLKIVFSGFDLPDWTDESVLGVDLQFDEVSYREMRRTLEKVTDAENNRLAELRNLLYGMGKARFGNDDTEWSENPDLNELQNEAVRQMLRAEDVFLIHGPPGTGKTTTLVDCIRQTLATEKQVMVCAPSNTAIDLLTEKLSASGLRVVRLGNPARISEHLFSLTLDAQVSEHPHYKELKRLRKNADEYRRLAGKYKRHYGPAEREQKRLLIDEARKTENEAGHLEFYITEETLNSARACCIYEFNGKSKMLMLGIKDAQSYALVGLQSRFVELLV